MVRYRILLVVLLLGTIASVFWSLDSALSAERAVHLTGSSIVAIYIGFMIPLISILRVFGVVLAMIMLASIGVVVAMPELGIESYQGAKVWSGVFNSKNSMGFWAAIGVLLYITLSDSTASIYSKLLCYLLTAMCFGLLTMSQSATSLLALLLAGSLSLYMYIAIRFQLGFIRMVVMAVLFIGLVAIGFVNIDTAELVGRAEDLTGRREVWRQVWNLIMQRPVTGYGYGALWFPSEATIWLQQSLTDFTWVVHHAHNGFLQVASEVGLPLSCIALLMVAQQLVEIFYCQYERQQVGVLFVLGFVVAYLVGNFSEARFLVNRELYWILFITLPISMLRQVNLMSSESSAASEADDTGNFVVVPGAALASVAATGEVAIAEAETAALTASVPGKPWVDLPAPDPAAAEPIAAATTKSWSDPMATGVEDAVWETWDFEHFPEIGSLTETDIDLGEILVEEEAVAAASELDPVEEQAHHAQATTPVEGQSHHAQAITSDTDMPVAVSESGVDAGEASHTRADSVMPAYNEQDELHTASASDDTFDPSEYGLEASVDEAMVAAQADMVKALGEAREPAADRDYDDTMDLTEDVADLSGDLTDDSLVDHLDEPDHDDTFDPSMYGIDVLPETNGSTDEAHSPHNKKKSKVDRFDRPFIETGDWVDIPLGD